MTTLKYKLLGDRSKYPTEHAYVTAGRNLHRLGEIKPVTIPWLPEIKLHKPLGVYDDCYRSIFSYIENENYTSNLWNLVTNAIPPYFSGKYHNVGVEDIIKVVDNDENYLALMTINCLWHESLGLPLMRIIHKKHKIYEPERKKYPGRFDILRSWKTECSELTDLLHLSWKGLDITPYTRKDLCNSAAEFLLEPCIHLQLPWKPILFHQWLTAALSQILIMEQETMEMRHLPLSETIVDIAKNFVNLIRQLKERVMLGFAILNQQVITYPNLDPKIHSIILDSVVLPSIPILDFLCNEKAIEIIKFIKLNMNNGKSFTYLPVESYTIDSSLAKLHANFMYNFNTWKCKVVPNLYPQVNEKFEDIIKRLNTEKCQVSNSTEHDKPLSLEEQQLLELTKNKTTGCVISDEELELMINLLDVNIIKKYYLTGITLNKVKKLILEQLKIQKHKDFYLNKAENDIQKLISQLLVYLDLYKLLINDGHCSLDPSVPMQLIYLQLKVVENETLARIIKTLRSLFNIHPKTNEKEIKNTSQYTTIITEVYTKMKNQNRGVFWSQFPQEWKESVPKVDADAIGKSIVKNDDEEYVPIEGMKDVLGTIIPKFKNRIGRLIFHQSKLAFDLVAQDYMPNTTNNFVHYLLPALLVAFYQGYKNERSPDSMYLFDPDFYNLLDCLLTVLESLHGNWINKVFPKRKILPDSYDSYDENCPGLQEFPFIILKFREYVRDNVGLVYNCSDTYEDHIQVFDKVLNNLHAFTNIVDEDEVPPEFLTILVDWYLGANKLFEILFQSSLIAFKIPIPGNPIPEYKELENIYFASGVMSELETLMEISKFYQEDTDFTLEAKVTKTFEGMKDLRFELLKQVISPYIYDTDEQKELFDKIRPKLLTSYIKLKEYRTFVKGNLNAYLQNMLPFKNLGFVSQKLLVAFFCFRDNKLDSLDRLLLPILQPAKQNTSKKSVLVAKRRSGGKKK